MSAGEEHEATPEVEPTHTSVGELLEGFRPRLERMLTLRLDPRLSRRVDPSDVLQDAFLEVTRRLDEFRSSRPMPFYLWVRLLAGQKLLEFHRRHLGAERRDVRREVPEPSFPEASTISLAPAFLAPTTPPSKAAERQEALRRVREALDELDEIDRETLVLRYFEQLSNEETAAVLGLSASGAKKRHLCALTQLLDRKTEQRAVLPRRSSESGSGPPDVNFRSSRAASSRSILGASRRRSVRRMRRRV